MTTRMIGDFRVRCTVVQESNLPLQRADLHAQGRCERAREMLAGARVGRLCQPSRSGKGQPVRFLIASMAYVSTGSPNLPMRPHNGWWKASSTPCRWMDQIDEAPSEGGAIADVPAAAVPRLSVEQGRLTRLPQDGQRCARRGISRAAQEKGRARMGTPFLFTPAAAFSDGGGSSRDGRGSGAGRRGSRPARGRPRAGARRPGGGI